MDKFKAYIPYIVIAILLLMYMSKCAKSENQLKKERDSWKYKEMMYANNRATLTHTIDSQGREITSQKALIVSKDQENEMLLIENKRLKNIRSEVKVVTDTRVDSIFVPFELNSIVTNTNDSTPPKKIFKVNNEWYGINGYVLHNGVMIDSISFKNELFVTIGEEKQGFMRKREVTVDIINASPYSSTSEVYNVIVKKRKKRWFETRAASFIVGGISTIFLLNKLR